jgi:hypothetical protein
LGLRPRLADAARSAAVTVAPRGPIPVPVALEVNGQPHLLTIEPRVTLLDALRERLRSGPVRRLHGARRRPAGQ